MPAYRDLYLSDTLHFPARLTACGLIGAAVGLSAFAIPLVIWTAPLHRPTWEVWLLLVIIVALLKVWPFDLLLGPEGLQQRGWLAPWRRMIRWDQLDRVEEHAELAYQKRGSSLAHTVVIFYPKGRGLSLRHTPRHEDRERLLVELARRGVPVTRLSGAE